MEKITAFNFKPGETIHHKYEILQLLGQGWEGEVYLVKEKETGIERAAKFFYPERNKGGKTSKRYAQKLHKLKHCDILIQYYGQETAFIDGTPVTFLISEFIDGELLSDFLLEQPGQRLHPYVAFHLLYALTSGMEEIHQMKEYHGDLHTENIIIQRVGLQFDVKLVDLYHWGAGSVEHIRDDVVDLIQIFHETIGGKKHYAKMPHAVKDICCGLKKSLIWKKVKTATQLQAYLERLEWG
jgi:serine/threonine protein kinase